MVFYYNFVKIWTLIRLRVIIEIYFVFNFINKKIQKSLIGRPKAMINSS